MSRIWTFESCKFLIKGLHHLALKLLFFVCVMLLQSSGKCYLIFVVFSVGFRHSVSFGQGAWCASGSSDWAFPVVLLVVPFIRVSVPVPGVAFAPLVTGVRASWRAEGFGCVGPLESILGVGGWIKDVNGTLDILSTSNYLYTVVVN